MSHKGWRARAAGVSLVVAGWAGGGVAQSPPPAVQQAAPVTPIAPGTPFSPPIPLADGIVKDLTPAVLAEPVPEREPLHSEAQAVLCKPAHGHAEEGGAFLSAEYLLWRPRRDAFDYAISNSTTGLATTGKLENLGYELQSGVRGTLGYRLPGGAWDTLFSYTHLGSSADARLLAPPGGVLLPTLTRPGLTDQAQSAAADASLMYNVYDIEVGKRVVLDEYFTGRVYGGFRFADIRQDLVVGYDGLDARQAAVTNKSSFYGAGPTFGAEGQFGGWHGFHIYARGGGGLLSGKINNPITETNNAGQTVYVNLVNDGQRVVPVAVVAIGGGWQRRTVSIRFGYEVTNYFGLASQPRFVDDVAQGKLVNKTADLSLEGFVARFGVAF